MGPAALKGLVAALALVAATPVAAQDEPRFCVNRPSLVDTPCTVEPGRVLLEMSALDWTLDNRSDAREDVVLSGDMQARIGFADHAELQLSWTAFGSSRTRDKATGRVERQTGVGDIRIAVRRNLFHPDGSGFSIAAEPYVTAPVGGEAIGAGDWGYGVVMPVNVDLSPKLSLQVMGSVDAAVDQDRSGRHLSYSGDWGLGYKLTDQWIAVAEVQVIADRDPLEPVTESTAAFSIAWQPHKTLQFDVLVGAGLNRDTPDFRLLTGGAILF